MRKAVSRIMPNRQKSQPDPTTEVSTKPSSTSNSLFKIDFNSVSDFYIALDNPHNSWLPGDEVSGQIILISKKNLANIVIALLLVGYVKINSISHSKLRPVKHTLFNYTIKIYGDEAGKSTDPNGVSNGLFKGEHRFPFIVKLPNKRIFTSIDFGKGSIAYLLRASMSDATVLGQQTEVPGSPGFLSKTKNLRILNNTYRTSEKLINLINPIDVSTLPAPKTKRLIIKDPRLSKKLSKTQSSTSTINTFNTYGTVSSNNSENSESPRDNEEENDGSLLAPQFLTNVTHDTTRQETIKVLLSTPKRGYLRGELIPVKLNISHLRKIQDLNGIIITLVRVCRMDNGPDGIYDSFRKDLAQQVIPLYVDPNTLKSEINSSIRIPADAFPTISECPLVSFQYFIEVLINLSGKSVSLDGESKTPLSNDNGRQSPMVKPGNQEENPSNIANVNDLRGQYKLSTTLGEINHNEWNFINTDKYKRMKKFLQLTSEVVVGTHRLETDALSPDSIGLSPTDVRMSNSPLSRRSSVSDGSLGAMPSLTTSSGTQFYNQGPIPNHPSFNAIPESIEITDFDGQVPGYNEINNGTELLPMPEQPVMSEKEQIQAHENSLMPSEPALGSDEESRESISPIIEDDILEEQADLDVLNDEHDDQYSRLDYVPNYERANNDTLIQPEQHQFSNS